jgi:hypothetical protein
MPFYAFRFDEIKVLETRAKILDDDVITFNVFVNNIERGRHARFFPSLDAGTVVHPGWIIGPFELAPNDAVAVVYSGTNTSDNQLDSTQQDQIEIKILDTITTAAVGAIGGPIGSVIGSVLGLIGDPVGKFLGFEPTGPCNGPLFFKSLQFTGGGLRDIPFQQGNGFLDTLPGATESHFSETLTGEATHSTACGDTPRTEVTVSVLQMLSISVRDCVVRRFPSADFLVEGLRRATGSNASSLRSLIGLRL